MEATDTKKCSFCQSDIPKKAKVCPSCKKDLRNWFSRHPIITFILFLIILGSIVSNNAETQVKNDKIISQAQNYNLISSGADADAAKLAEQVKAKNKETLAKVQIASAAVVDVYGFPHLNVNLKNNTGREIDALTLKASFKDNFNKPIVASISGDKYFQGIIQEKLGFKQFPAQWQLSLFDNATKVDEIQITKIHFVDKDETVEVE